MGQPVSEYGRLSGFAHQLLICLAAITLAGVLTTPRRYDRLDACSAHVASEQLLHICHTQCVPKAAHREFLAPPYQVPGSPAAARVLARCGPHCLMSLLRHPACEAIGSVRTARSLRLRRYTHRGLPRYSRARLEDFVGVCRRLNLAVSDSMSALVCTERPLGKHPAVSLRN